MFCSFVQALILYDLNYNRVMDVSLYKYYFEFDQHKIAAYDDTIYLWNDNIILVIAENNVKVISNVQCIQVYSAYYNVFIDRDMKLYRIFRGKLLYHKLDYDFWHDTDKPKNIETVIDILVEMHLFPPEICNIIYSELFYCSYAH